MRRPGGLLFPHPEPVIRIPELRWNAAPRRAPRKLDMMPPRPAARRPSNPPRRPLRILALRHRVVPRVVPIRAPLMHVLAHVEESVAVRLERRHRLRPLLPPPRLVHPRLIAPGIELPLH